MKLNEIIHLNYPYPGQGDDNEKPAFLTNNDLPGCVWLNFLPFSTDENAATALTCWNRILTAVHVSLSDHGSH